MIVHLIRLPSLRFSKVQYYTAHLEGRKASEFGDFQKRMSVSEADVGEFAEINRFIEQIGELHGAYPKYFKAEGAAERLPPPYHYIETDAYGDFGLRLYCIRLSSSVVILLNGDRKTAQKVQDCPQCKPHFDKAQRLSKAIDKAIVEGYLSIDEEAMELEIDEDFDLYI